MVDRDRILEKLEDLDRHLGELRAAVPARAEDYRNLEKRACERLLQIAIETVIDVCALLVKGLRLGVPGEEDDLFEKLLAHGALSREVAGILRRMKRLRNLLVPEYARVSDEIVFNALHQNLGDFDAFKREVLAFLRRL